MLHRTTSHGVSALLLGLTLLAASAAHAQPGGSLTLSAGAGYEVGSASYESTVYNPCPCTTGGIVNGRIEGPTAHVDLELGNMARGDLGTVGLRGRLELGSAITTRGFSYELRDVELLLEGVIEPIDQSVGISTRFALFDARFTLLGTCTTPFGVSMALGPYVGYRSVPKFAMSQTLLEPKNARFSYSGGALAVRDNGRKLIMDDGRRQQMRHIAAGGLFLLSYPIALGGGLGVSPELRLRADLLPPFVSDSWMMLGMGAGLSLSYTLSPSGR